MRSKLNFVGKWRHLRNVCENKSILSTCAIWPLCSRRLRRYAIYWEAFQLSICTWFNDVAQMMQVVNDFVVKLLIDIV